jgi:hypothetical protein
MTLNYKKMTSIEERIISKSRMSQIAMKKASSNKEMCWKRLNIDG